MAEEKKRALGFYSRYVYPIWFFVVVGVIWYFEGVRNANWQDAVGMNSKPYEVVAAGHQEIMVQFLVTLGCLVLVPYIWHYVVSRDKKKYPERYRKY